jgi:immune inhibitor A
MSNRRIVLIIVGVAVTMMACVACFLLVGGASFLVAREIAQSDGGPVVESTESGPTPEVVRTVELPSTETLETLENTIVPENNPVDLAEELLGVEDIPATVPGPTTPYQVGDRRTFSVTNSETEENFETEAVLRYVSDLLYFWVEDGVEYEQEDLVALAETFENEILPTNRAFFGSEWTPGIDNDPHLYVLYTTNVGSQTAGYFSSADEIPPQAHPFSNAVEMFVFNADNSPLWDQYTYGVFAHEFQHMIHWYRDRNESSWLNEGLSELATLLNGYVHTGFAQLYTSAPDLQLTDWPDDPNATPPHYGAGFMFTTYFMDRFGAEATQALVADQANSLDSVDDVVAQLGLVVESTGEPLNGDTVVRDWMLANYLQDASMDDGRYGYPSYPNLFPAARLAERVTDCSPGTQDRSVKQYGVDYIYIACDGPVTLHFEGSTQVGLLPADPYSGDYAFWSNKGDSSDMRLTQRFDFSDVSGPLTLSYWTWYNIEEDWDYAYVLASIDDGATWDFLQTPNMTDTNPNGNSYGWAYTGFSGGVENDSVWIQESIDLSQYAGQDVLLRFEYITDAAVNGEGFLLDNVSIDQIGYFSDFETDMAGWEAEGWARVQNVLPQTFTLALVTHGATTQVQVIDVPAGNQVELPLEFGSGVDGYTLMVSGSTRFTRQAAGYRYNFTP